MMIVMVHYMPAIVRVKRGTFSRLMDVPICPFDGRPLIPSEGRSRACMYCRQVFLLEPGLPPGVDPLGRW